MKEKVKERFFYRDLTVSVTQSRYITGDKTYALSNISSVTINRIKESRFNPRVVIITGLIALFIPNDFQIMIGGILLIVGIMWHINIRDSFTVRISTNSGETDSIISSDEDYIKKIVSALNEAIIYRG
ncbi:DUF6232 family protein [Flavobacterium sp. WV_118_3]|uniref:DUF6232 family protein n=1 Tax=Flavobacterium sp. WV_118_3 TaxID=3151764 RepID=UPI00321C147F